MWIKKSRWDKYRTNTSDFLFCFVGESVGRICRLKIWLLFISRISMQSIHHKPKLIFSAKSSNFLIRSKYKLRKGTNYFFFFGASFRKRAFSLCINYYIILGLKMESESMFESKANERLWSISDCIIRNRTPFSNPFHSHRWRCYSITVDCVSCTHKWCEFDSYRWIGINEANKKHNRL